MRYTRPPSMVLTAASALVVASAGAQPNDHGFVPGHIFFGETELEACRFGQYEGLRFVRELDPVTGQSWRIMDRDDGLCFPGGEKFTPNGRYLRIVDAIGNQVFQIDSAGNSATVYDAADGLNGPTGPAYDRQGNFYVANYYAANIIRFPLDHPPPALFVAHVPIAADLVFAPNGDLLYPDVDCCIHRVRPDGSTSVFDNIGNQVYVGSITFDDAGNLFACVSDVLHVYFYRYDGGVAANRRRVATMPFGPGSLSFEPATGYLLWLHRFALERVNPDTGAAETLFEFPDNHPTEGTTNGAGRAVAFAPPVPGDLNCDRRIDFFDIDPFIAALKGQDAYDAAYGFCDRSLADLNADGTVNPFDVQPFVELLSAP